MKDISIIIPTLNEAENIDPLIAKINSTMLAHKYDFEIIFVDDDSTDTTREKILNHCKAQKNIKLIHRKNEKGLATAVYCGAQNADSEIVVIMDADLSHPPKSLPQIIDPVIQEKQDIVIASRYIKGGSVENWPLLRQIMSRTAKLPAKVFTNIKDPLSGFFAVKKHLLLKNAENVPGYKIGLEILARGRSTIRAYEVPITFQDRQLGCSKTNMNQIMNYIKQLFCLAGANITNETFFKFCIIGLMGFVIDFSLFNILVYSKISIATANITSFLTAFLFNFILNKNWAFKQSSNKNSFLIYSQIAIAAFILRAGCLKILMESWGMNHAFAGFLSILTGAFINYIGNSFITFSKNKNSQTVISYMFVIYLFILRFVFLGLPELMHEEAYYWNYSQHLALGYLDHPPMISWLIFVTTSIFGNNEFAIRLVPFMCWIFSAFFIFLLCKEMLGEKKALFGIFIFSTLPGFFCIGFLATPDAPLTAFWIMTIYFLYKALNKNDSKSWYFAGIGLGLGLLSKYTIILLVPAAFIFIITNKHLIKELIKPQPYIAVLIAAAIFSPVIIWNSQNNWASFIFQGPRRFTSSFDFSLFQLAGAILLIITPAGLSAFLNFQFSKKTKKQILHYINKSNLLFILIFSIVPLWVFICFSLVRQTKLNWTLPIWTVFIPVMSVFISNKKIKSKLIPSLYITPALLGLILYYSSFGIPGIPYFTDSPFLFGWENMTKQISLNKQDNIENIDIIAGLDKYKIASALSFYEQKINSHKKITGRNLFDENSLMYNYWSKSNNFKGKNILILSASKKKLSSSKIDSNFRELGEIKKIQLSKNNMKVKNYYYRIGYDYSPLKNEKLNKYKRTVFAHKTKHDFDIEPFLMVYSLLKDKPLFTVK